jgi:hypothetical protein
VHSLARAKDQGPRQVSASRRPGSALSTVLCLGVVAATGPAIVGIMTRIERLTERAITFAIAEPNQSLAVARLAFLAHGDYPALDAAIDAYLARRDRSLRTRWRAISFLSSSPLRGPPAAWSAGRNHHRLRRQGRARGAPGA